MNELLKLLAPYFKQIIREVLDERESFQQKQIAHNQRDND